MSTPCPARARITGTVPTWRMPAERAGCTVAFGSLLLSAGAVANR